MVTDLRKILKYTVIDVETRQTIAGFATDAGAMYYVAYLGEKTGRDYEIAKS